MSSESPEVWRPADADPVSFAELLELLWPFSELPRSVLLAILEQMQVQRFSPGDVLIRQGRRGRYLFILLEGTLKICVKDGPRCHEIARPAGEVILGEMGVMTDGPCTATATAVTPVRVLALSVSRFRRLASRYPVLCAALGHLMATRLGYDPIDSLVGKVLHGYRVQRCVGWGGMATVYEAEAFRDGGRVALKMMSHRFAQDLDVQKRFEREVQICWSLRHPNIAQILDNFICFGTSFMVLEFCSGVTVGELIQRRGPLPEVEARNILHQLAGALAYAHRQGICHRDVKPRNMMLDETGMLKLMDFGLARSVTGCELTSHACILGTPSYMSPEQLRGESVDYRADLFAVGCVVYEMLAGESPFAGRDLAEVLERQFRWSLPPADCIRPGLGPDLYRVLQQSLVMKPAERVLDLEQLASL
jgi:hypothetical protein